MPVPTESFDLPEASDLAGLEDPSYDLALYIAGGRNRSRRAIDAIQSIGAGALNGRFRLTIIDVLQRPDLAETMNILATPTLIRLIPQPCRRIVGNLSDRSAVAAALED